MYFSLIFIYSYVKLSDGKIQGFGGVRNATTPSIISEVPYAEGVACGGYHTCVVTSNTLLLMSAFFAIEFACVNCKCLSCSNFFSLFFIEAQNCFLFSAKYMNILSL